MKRLFITLLLLSGLSAGSGFAGEDDRSSTYPAIPKAVGEPHPEGNEYMRINHMDLLRHDRDETMRLGNRDIDYSLKACVACHAVNGPDAQPVGYESGQFFCNVCHTYAAVQIDCFTCHTSKPDEDVLQKLLSDGDGARLRGARPPDATRLVDYIQSMERAPRDQLARIAPAENGAGQ